MGALDFKFSRRKSPWRIDRNGRLGVGFSRSQERGRSECSALQEVNPNYSGIDKFAMITVAMARANIKYEITITLPRQERGRGIVEPEMFQIEINTIVRCHKLLDAPDAEPSDK